MGTWWRGRRGARGQIRTVLSVAAVGAFVAVLAACGGGSASSNGKKVQFSLDFNILGRHAFFYTALDKGYYKDVGLDPQFHKSGGSADAIKAVSSGNAQLGYADAATLVVAKGQQENPVKLVNVVYQTAPYGIFCLKNRGISKPKDLEGHTIADGPGSSVTAMFPAYAKLAGIDLSKVKHTVSDPSTLVSLLATGKVDCVAQNIMGAAVIDQNTDQPVTELKYSAAGLKTYSNGIIATESTLQNDPELVRKFVAATTRGMKYAFAHPVEAGEIFHKYNPTIDASVATAETKVVASLAETPVTKRRGLGYIDPATMKNTIQVVKQSFDMKRNVAVKEMYQSGFLPKSTDE